MALYKISDFYADYQNTIQGIDIKSMSVYTQETGEKIGAVTDALVDDEGEFRYLIVDIDFWIFGKKVLLPIECGRIDSDANRVYVAMTKQQVEDLPEYEVCTMFNYDYSEQAPLDTSALLAMAAIASSVAVADRIAPVYDRETYSYSNSYK